MEKTKYIVVLLLTACLSACNNWLDVKPQGQVEEENMFDEEAGFLQVLTGTYTLLNASAAYGEELTIGFVDEIVHYWNERSKFYIADYKDAEVVSRLDATWRQMYKAIANVNLLLKNLEGKDKADFENYNLIKGEALGLRAYLHLDLLRLYGPVLKDGLNQTAIPYHEEFSNDLVDRMTAEKVLEKIERDLLEAYELLKEDPVRTYGRTSSSVSDNTDLAFRFRGIRMNYFAVCGTLARLYQLKNDPVKTLQYANEILEETELWKLLQRDDIVSDKPDLMFERELIWGVYDQKMEDKIIRQIKDNFAYTIDLPFKTFVYERSEVYGSPEDYRDARWWAEIKLSISYWILNKYNRIYGMASSVDGTKEDVTPWKKLLPMIRLSEIYYIAAEAQLETDPAESWRLINAVRESRGITPLPETIKTDKVLLKYQLIYEYQKEFWGEGKLFYLYKRLFHDMITRDGNIPASKALFELPIPEDEVTYLGNKNQ